MSGIAVASAIDLIFRLIDQAVKMSLLVKAARAEGRDVLTEAEWAPVLEENAQARVDFEAAIALAKAEGR